MGDLVDEQETSVDHPADPTPVPHPRRRVPWWAMPVLAVLPVWAYLFHGTLEPGPAGDGDPVTAGAGVYAGNRCGACHGDRGEGRGAAPALDRVDVHFPDWRDHMVWVRVGATGWPGDTYGDGVAKAGGGMPGFGNLSDRELAQVVLYERVTHAGMDPSSEELADLVAIATGELTFADTGLGQAAEAAGIDPRVIAER